MWDRGPGNGLRAVSPARQFPSHMKPRRCLWFIAGHALDNLSELREYMRELCDKGRTLPDEAPSRLLSTARQGETPAGLKFSRNCTTRGCLDLNRCRARPRAGPNKVDMYLRFTGPAKSARVGLALLHQVVRLSEDRMLGDLATSRPLRSTLLHAGRFQPPEATALRQSSVEVCAVSDVPAPRDGQVCAVRSRVKARPHVLAALPSTALSVLFRTSACVLGGMASCGVALAWIS